MDLSHPLVGETSFCGSFYVVPGSGVFGSENQRNIQMGFEGQVSGLVVSQSTVSETFGEMTGATNVFSVIFE